MRILIAPILLKKTTSIKFPLSIDKGVFIRDFPTRKREEFFRLVKELEAFLVGRVGIEDFFSLLRAKSCIEVKVKDEVPTSILKEKMEFMNCTLKVLKRGSAGYFIGRFFGKKSSDFLPGTTTFSEINPIYGEEYTLRKNDAQELKEIYRIISKSKKDKTIMLLEKFILSVSKNLKKHIRALEFFSILESLYLPGTEHGELRFRLSQRMAKMLFKSKIYEEYKEIMRLYNKRSALVHQSKDTFTKQELNKLEDLTRASLKLYLKSPKLFKDKYLDKLFL